MKMSYIHIPMVSCIKTMSCLDFWSSQKMKTL